MSRTPQDTPNDARNSIRSTGRIRRRLAQASVHPAMQNEYYGQPRHPVLEDARRLYDWAIAPQPRDGGFHLIADGPPVMIIEHAPSFPAHAAKRPAQIALEAGGSDSRPRPAGCGN